MINYINFVHKIHLIIQVIIKILIVNFFFNKQFLNKNVPILFSDRAQRVLNEIQINDPGILIIKILIVKFLSFNKKYFYFLKIF